MHKNIFKLFLFLYISFPIVLSAQEVVKSIEEEYYYFLYLQGLTDRPTLNYRTFSDSVWSVNEDVSHPWQGQNLGTWIDLFGDFRLRSYGPELFMSGNTKVPYGYNDGLLWQGHGFNTLIKGGVRFEGYGIELTLLPHFAFSQNAAFDILPSSYENIYGYFWGYGYNMGVDSPQRFGDKHFFDWDLGDSEIRYTWKTLTIGFGTQAIWLGPAYISPILHSNNAPAYPKFDIGLRRQKVTLPWLGWYIGDIEARLWTGRLSESDYFDDNQSNNYTMINGIAFAYAPSFLSGLTLFFNWVDLLPWEWKNLKYILPIDTSNTIEDDMKASFGFSWAFPQVGFEVFGEIGIDDYVAGGISGYLRRPNHTTVFSLGLKKIIPISPPKNIYGELLMEANYMEKTLEYSQIPYSFYSHHNIIHGYTNKGQWLGNALSPIGNAQILKFTLYYPDGNSSIMFSRYNSNNHYIYEKEIYSGDFIYHNAHWGNLDTGLATTYFINSYFQISGGIVYNLIINHNYQRRDNDRGADDTHMHNFSFNFGLKFIF